MDNGQETIHMTETSQEGSEIKYFYGGSMRKLMHPFFKLLECGIVQVTKNGDTEMAGILRKEIERLEKAEIGLTSKIYID